MRKLTILFVLLLFTLIGYSQNNPQFKGTVNTDRLRFRGTNDTIWHLKYDGTKLYFNQDTISFGGGNVDSTKTPFMYKYGGIVQRDSTFPVGMGSVPEPMTKFYIESGLTKTIHSVNTNVGGTAVTGEGSIGVFGRGYTSGGVSYGVVGQSDPHGWAGVFPGLNADSLYLNSTEVGNGLLRVLVIDTITGKVKHYNWPGGWISGSGAAGYYPLYSGSTVIGNGTLTHSVGLNTSTDPMSVSQGMSVLSGTGNAGIMVQSSAGSTNVTVQSNTAASPSYLLLTAGDGTNSSRSIYSSYSLIETKSVVWYAGIRGDNKYSIEVHTPKQVPTVRVMEVDTTGTTEFFKPVIIPEPQITSDDTISKVPGGLRFVDGSFYGCRASSGGQYVWKKIHID